MKHTLQVLEIISSVSFGSLWIPAFLHWRRDRNRASGTILLSLGLFGLMTVMGRVGQLIGSPRALHDVQIFVFLASGYTLLLVRNAFVPIPRAVHQAIIVVLGLTGIVTVFARLPLQREAHLTTSQNAVLLLVVGVWAACAAEPAYRFWKASRGRPVVQRARLRAIGFGYGGLVGILLIAVSLSRFTRQPGVALALSLASLCLAPALVAGFFPPAWLRRAWREPQEVELRQSVQDFLEYSPDATQIARRGVEHAAALIGADAGVIADAKGEPLAIVGMSEDEARTLIARWDGESRQICSRADGALPRQAVVVPLAASARQGTLILVAGPFTPLFGSDEIARLRYHGLAIATAMDRARLSVELANQTEVHSSLLQALSDLGEGFIVTDHWRVVFSNEAYRAMSGYSEEELRVLPSYEALLAGDDELRLMLTGRPGSPWMPSESHFETILRRRDGTSLDVEVSLTSFTKEPGSVVAVFRDITDRRRMVAALREQAMVDSLTGLPNRRAFFDLAEDRRRLARRSGEGIGILFADVDNLKAANDTFGHSEGDAVLVDVARVLTQTFRDSDVVARVGGDEFCVLLGGEFDELAVLNRISSFIDRHNAVSQRTTKISLSVGIARIDAEGNESIADLVNAADRAMYGEKLTRRSMGKAG